LQQHPLFADAGALGAMSATAVTARSKSEHPASADRRAPDPCLQVSPRDRKVCANVRWSRSRSRRATDGAVPFPVPVSRVIRKCGIETRLSKAHIGNYD